MSAPKLHVNRICLFINSKLDSFILCCYAKKTIPNLKKCESQSNSFSSCEDMLKSIVIRVGIWIQGLFASFGNFAVILWWTVLSRRNSSNVSRKSNVQSLLLRNLALADFLMGIYLLFIAIQDALWKGEYVDHDVEWRSGISCQIAGAISTLSSEVSVMMLVVLTGDRFSTIVFDFKGKRLNLKTAYCFCFAVWVIGIAIAFTPLFATSYFNDETTQLLILWTIDCLPCLSTFIRETCRMGVLRCCFHGL